MKRNRESKYKQKIINFMHMNKSKQKCLDILVQKYGATYYGLYQFYVKRNFSYLKDTITKMFENEMSDVFKSFGDMSKLPINLFEQINPKRPFYLGIDFARGNDWIGKITLNGMENK